MSKLASALAGLALLIVTVGPAQAQEGYSAQKPSYASVEVLTVPPAQASAFLAAVAKIVEAAEQAELPGKYGWSLYSRDNTFYVVTTPESMASFDDENEWMRQFAGTPGQATLEEGFAMFADVDVSANTRVLQAMPDWTYMPENGSVEIGRHDGAFVAQDWVKFGQEEAFNESTKKVMALLKDIDFAYPVLGYRVRIGDAGLCEFVVLHDGLGNFYGENSLEAALAKAGKAEEWAKLARERSEMVSRTHSFTTSFLAAYGYPAPAEAAGAGGSD